MNKYEQLEKVTGLIFSFEKKLESINGPLSHDDGLKLLREVNSIFSFCNSGAYGYETYLFDAAVKKLRKIYSKFWKRIDKYDTQLNK